MPAPRDPKALLQVARLYYLENLSQQQIAAQLDISRSNVSRMLTDALAQGIVEIRINDPAGRERDSRASLEETFGLARRPRRAAPGALAGGRTGDQVGVLAAQVLLQSQGPDDGGAVVGPCTPGDGVGDHDRPRPRRLSWSSWSAGCRRSATRSAGTSWSVSSPRGSAPRTAILHAPATLDHPRASDALLQEQSIAKRSAAARSADIAFVGIGTPAHGSSAAILASLDLSKDEARRVLAAEARRRHRGPLLRRERPAIPAPSTTESSPSPSRTWSRSPPWSASPTAAPRCPACSAPYAAG